MQTVFSAVARITTSAPDPKPCRSQEFEDQTPPVIQPSVFRHHKARYVEGDGHCCIRALSLCLVGNEEWYLGLRLIVIVVFLEAVLICTGR